VLASVLSACFVGHIVEALVGQADLGSVGGSFVHYCDRRAGQLPEKIRQILGGPGIHSSMQLCLSFPGPTRSPLPNAFMSQNFTSLDGASKAN
jgi:hypothetical protein